MHFVQPVAGCSGTDPGSITDGDYSFTADQLLRLVWNAAGATMAAVGVPQDDLLALGQQVAPTLHQLVREYGITIPDSYRQ